MANFSDEDDDFLVETKDFLQRAAQASQSQPHSAEAEEPELVDVSGANTQAWLMKVPDFLANHFKSNNQDGDALGTVRVFPTTREFQLILSNDGAAASGIPQVYDLTFNPDTTSVNTYVFAEPNRITCEPASICAKVANEGHVLPQTGNLNYRQILHGRQERRRSIQRLEVNFTGSPTTERQGGMFMPGLARPKAFVHKTLKPKETKGGKRARVPHNELMDDIFVAFTKHQYWSKPALLHRIYVSWAQLKDMMEEMCIYHSKGPYHGTYELKPHLSGRFDADASGSASSIAHTSEEPNAAAAGSTSIEVVEEEDLSDLTDEDDLEECLV
ncbi:hypothetical protein BG006_000124 [Podila minutissima]|uniref:Transcription initiation factor IIF subunit beta n=1 Tax=Podila minutissima TaxID=64525 RepID=A0A9P5SPU4_9FUNG|nr:hypothetical protein BG006_000124 [Podila minutissima]